MKQPEPIDNFEIDEETLDHLDPLSQLAARIAISKGKWRLIKKPMAGAKT